MKKLVILFFMMMASLSFSITLYTEKGEKKKFFTTNAQKTKNYEINTVGFMTAEDESNPGKSKVQFVVGFDLLDKKLELENVKVYVIVPNKEEKLIVESEMPKGAKKLNEVEKGKYSVKMDTKTGINSRVGNAIVQTPGRDIDDLDWSGFSEYFKSVSVNELYSNKKYGYLFKFVIKAKGMPEETIYQPSILNVQLPGAQKI